MHMDYHKNFKKFISSVLIIVIIFHGSIFLRSQQKDEIANQYDKALSAYSSGQYYSSKLRLEKVIGHIQEKHLEVEKKDILGKCYLLLGAISEKKDETPLAKENYLKAKVEYGIEIIEGVELNGLPLYRRIVKGEIDIDTPFREAVEEYNDGQYDNSRHSIEQLIGIIKRENLDKREILGQCYLLLGTIYEKKGESLPAKENYKRAKGYGVENIAGVDLNGLPLYRRVVKGEIDIDTPFQKAIEEYNNGQYDNSKFSLEKVIGTIKEANLDKKEILGKSCLLLGAISEKKGETPLAEENYRRAKEEYGVKSIEGVDWYGLPLYKRVVLEIVVKEGIIEKTRGKKKFPALLVVGGVAVIAVVVMLLTKKKKTTPETSTPEFVTNMDSLSVPEGGTAAFQVRLSTQPSSDVSVTVTRVSGDTDITVQSGSSLTFTTANWTQNQTVTLAAAEDVDITNGSAVIRISAPGMQNKDITAVEQDNDVLSFVTNMDTVNIPEGGTNFFTVKLSNQPTAEVQASVTWVSGDTDISVQSGGRLTFSTSNWNQNQMVTLAANEDMDTINGSATIRISATGFQDKDITAVEQDNDALHFVTDKDTIYVPEGNTNTFTVMLSNQPAADVQAAVSRVSGDTDISVQSGGSLTFTTSNWNTAQTVTLRAAEDSDTVNGQAVIRISATGIQDKDVTAIENDKGCNISIAITSPSNNATVSGTITIQAAVTGDCVVDRVEFYIDGDLINTDTSSPYTYNWNTTSYANGTHFIKAVAVDNIGRMAEYEIFVTVSN